MVLPLDHGFTAPEVAVLTEQDMLGDRLVRRKKRRKSADAFLAELAALTPGDLVVHADHGIARYEGLTSIQVGKAPHDCVALEYAGGDKLYVPVENIDVLSRYGADSERRDARPAGRRGVAAAQVADEGADPRDRGRADQDRRAARHPPRPDRRSRQRLSRSSSTASPMRRPTTRTARSTKCSTTWQRQADGPAGVRRRRLRQDRGRAARRLRRGDGRLPGGAGLPDHPARPPAFPNFVERFQGFPIEIGRLSRLVPAAEAKKTREGLEEGRSTSSSAPMRCWRNRSSSRNWAWSLSTRSSISESPTRSG